MSNNKELWQIKLSDWKPKKKEPAPDDEEEIYTGVFPGYARARIIRIGEYKGREFRITTTGRYPCAYVEAKTEAEIGCRDIWKLDELADVHWGFSFHGYMNHVGDISKKYFIGWDYGHCCDYAAPLRICTPERLMTFGNQGKKWTIDEIIDDIKRVIDQLEEHKKHND